MINKSSNIFNADQLNLINKGLKFKPKPVTPPINEIVISIELSIKGLEQAEKQIWEERLWIAWKVRIKGQYEDKKDSH